MIQRCLRRIREEYDQNEQNLYNYTKQDSIILNIQRACEASIDLAMHLVAEEHLGIPQSSREAFSYLEENQIITPKLSDQMKRMVGFRNIAVHDYQCVNLSILRQVITKHLSDFESYSDAIRIYHAKNNPLN